MSKIRITAVLTIVCMITVGLAGCTTFDNFKAAFIDKNQDQGQSDVIQIGVLEPVTGADSVNAEAEIRGIQLANSVHPEVNGKRISLVFSDDKSDIDATETAAETLIEKEPLVILGSYGSVYSLAASPYIKKAGIPAISITNTNPLVTRNNPYYYRVCYVDSNQGELLARYVTESKEEKTAGVLIPKGDDAARAMARSFTSRVKADTENDKAIAFYEEYQTGQEDYTGVLNKLKKSGVNSVILPGEYTDAANIINQAHRMGLEVQFLGDTTWGEEKFSDLLSEEVTEENFAYVQFFAADSGAEGEAITEEREAFLEAYAKEYGSNSEPTDDIALGYDAYFVAVDAIGRIDGTATSEKVNEILSDQNYAFEGASGHINFDSNGDPVKTAYISSKRDGNTVTIYTVEAEE